MKSNSFRRILFGSLFIVLLICNSNSFATHIVGGNVYYRYLGANKYEITLEFVRDCRPTSIDFDAYAIIGVFDGNGNKYDSLLILTRDTFPIIPFVNNPCLIPPTTICYQMAHYVDTITLPPSINGYTFTFQRCCRNNTLINIINPLGTGASYVAVMPGTSLVPTNSNPVFKKWPPAFLCVNQPFAFDHSAIDYDGDSLTYEVYQPYDGLSSASPGPIFPTPPPYIPVTWQSPYGTSNMLGGVPLTMDVHTGLLTCTPNTLGQFVVGMKCKEFRNGVLIGETIRDYEFNVVDCPFTIVAALQTPAFVCSSNNVTFTNESSGANTYYWNFGDGTTLADTSTLFSPTYLYPDTGTFDVTLIAKGNPAGCNDTTTGQVTVVHAPFNLNATANPTTIHKGETSQLNATSTDTTLTYVWTPAEGLSDTSIADPIATVTETTDYYVTATDKNGCSYRKKVRIIVITSECVEPDIFIPDAFTPNDDGENDVFLVRSRTISEIYFAVYNRWGEMVFETKELGKGWDGTYKGMKADPAVFGYYVKAKCYNGKDFFKKGNVTLIR